MEPEIQKRRISRRDAIKAGGIAAVGLAFSKPVIETIYPKAAFAQASPPPPTGPLGACIFGASADGVDAQDRECVLLTQAQCESEGGEYQGDGVECRNIF